MSDYDDYDDDEYLSLDDVVENEEYGDYGDDVDWGDNMDDMDSGEWGDQYGYSDDDVVDDEVDPWGLN